MVRGAKRYGDGGGGVRNAGAGGVAWALATAGGALLGLALGAASCSEDESSDPSTTTSGDGGATTSTTASTSSTIVSTTSSSSSTTGSEGGSGGAAAGWYGELPTLANDPLCYDWGQVSPAAGEAGHLYAVRLTPPAYPFVVDEVQYELWGEDGCDNAVAHRLEIFVDTGTSPPASPASPVVVDVPAAPSNEVPIRVVRQTLPSPIELLQDEQLFVAVELPNVDTSCIAVCAAATFADRDYWSGATGAPYDWQPLASYGFEVSARIGANGASP